MSRAKENYTYLITTSILDSFNWFNSCPPSWRDRAYASIIGNIKREPWKPHPTAKRGIQFESMIYAHARLQESEEGTKYFQNIVDKCRGGKFQQVLKKEINVRGKTVVLYGKVDVLFPDRILDIKTTENYRGDDKYLSGWQHILYLYMSGLKEFTYLVALFEEYPSLKIVDIYETPFRIQNPSSLLLDIKAGVETFHDWLESENLFFDYEQKFSNNSRK